MKKIIKYLFYTPSFETETQDKEKYKTDDNKETFIKELFKRDGKKIVQEIIEKNKEKSKYDFRGLYVHPVLGITGIVRVPENAIVENYESYIHLLDDNVSDLTIDYIIKNIENPGNEKISKVLNDFVSNLINNKTSNFINLDTLNQKFDEIKGEIDSKIGAVFVYKGSVETETDLPTENKIGDTYNVKENGANYVWTGTEWDKLSETIDLSEYAKKSEIPGFKGETSDLKAVQDTSKKGDIYKFTSDNALYIFDGTDFLKFADFESEGNGVDI